MNRAFGIVLAILVGIAAGMCFLLSINNVVHQSMLPLGNDLRSISMDLSEIKKNIVSSNGSAQVLDRLAVIEKRLQSIEDKMVANPTPAPAAPQMPPAEDYDKVYNIETGKSYVKGKKDAPVTIVAFTDFQCPFCARFHGPFQEVLKQFPDKVNFMIKNYPLPFHPFARPAAKAALAAGEQGKYFEMVDALLANQQQMLNDEGYKELAKRIGLNVDRFSKDLKNNDAAYEEIINNDLKLVDAFDVRGTPTFFIGGKKTMARDPAAIKAAVEQALAEKGIR
ncbi:MAG: thioredoxin domain-containing protein [Candidatus Omnitrophica bacterium]|nr:thioredoxin domain-containing protein [Candidatus Omnitrophota bacterium]